jgi:tyrosyl-tRNA synthetase
MREWGQEAQVVMTLPLLVGLDGVEKMSKSLGNYIGVHERPDEIFGKVMSVSDDLMWSYYTLLTDRRPHDIDALRASVASGALHPKRAKMDLARQLVADFHGAEASATAEGEFERRFAKADGPVQAVEMASPLPLPAATGALVAALGLAPSNTVARQKIREGAVSVSDDGSEWRKVDNPAEPFDVSPGGFRYVKVGKRFLKVLSAGKG